MTRPLLLSAALLCSLTLACGDAPDVGTDVGVERTEARPGSSSGYRFDRLASPARTEVYDAKNRWAATFTDGARTVTVRARSRTLTEPGSPAQVTTTVSVRLLTHPFAGGVDTAWLDRALADTSPDLLDVASQYLAGAPAQLEPSGQQFAGDAHYGPLQADGTRQEGSDFNDYLGVPWTYDDGTTDDPESAQWLSLDCSGFVRMVFGYRHGMAMSLRPVADGSTLPRRAFEQYEGGPGTILIPDAGVVPTDRTALRPGDLVFFDASTDDGTAIDHVGLYLGADADGRPRFMSSRKSIDGPTLGDYRGDSTLDGTGLYARSFRAARRL